MFLICNHFPLIGTSLLKLPLASLSCFDLSEVKVISMSWSFQSQIVSLHFYRQAGGGPSTERHSSYLGVFVVNLTKLLNVKRIFGFDTF